MTTFQILGQKFVKFLVGILVQTMALKGHFEINRPLRPRNKSFVFILDFCPVEETFTLWKKIVLAGQCQNANLYIHYVNSRKSKIIINLASTRISNIFFSQWKINWSKRVKTYYFQWRPGIALGVTQTACIQTYHVTC